MDLLLELLLDFLGELLLGGLLEGLGELFRPAGRKVISVLPPGGPPPGPHPLLACLGAVVLGAALGVASVHLLPARLIPTGAAAVTSWLALPLGAGLTAVGLDRLRSEEDRRSSALAFVAGALLGLAWLGARAVGL